MKDDERIDLSSLDPSRDEARWERSLAAVAARAAEARRPSLQRQLRAWAQPALGMAALLAVLVWAVTLLRPHAGPRPSRARGNVYQIFEWAQSGEVPEDLSGVLEAFDGR